MIDSLHEVKHREKRYKCSLCPKQYVFTKNAWRHGQKKHEGKAKFQPLGKFKMVEG